MCIAGYSLGRELEVRLVRYSRLLSSILGIGWQALVFEDESVALLCAIIRNSLQRGD